MPSFVDALAEVFVPEDTLTERFSDFLDMLNSKFPFSLANSLSLDGVEVGTSAAPTSIGWIPLNTAPMADFFDFVRVVAAIVIWVFIIWFIVDRLTPQAVV